PPGHVLDNARLDDGNNDPLRGRDIPGMAVDPADPKHVVLIDEDFLAGQCDFHTSYDAGKTWTSGHLTAPADFADPPCFTFDSGGYAHYNKSVVFGTGQNVYTTFASHRGEQQRPETGKAAGEGDSVIVNRSTDGGKTFQRGVVAIEGAKDSRPFIIRPGIAVQPRPQGDKLYVVGWYVVNPLNMGASGGQGDRRAVVASSEDGGATWSRPVEAQGPDEKVREIAPPVVGTDGAVYIAWRNRDDPATAPHPIVVAKSTDGGTTWTRAPIGDVGPAPTNVPAPAGTSGYPRMAVDPRSGALYIVYVGFNFGDLDVVFQRSTDGGTTWSAPKRVNDDPANNGVRQLTPQVFVAPNARVDVIWMDTRATLPSPIVPRPAGLGDIYYASSSDGGNTFSSGRRITDRSFNLDEGLLGRIGTYTWWGPAEAPIGNDTVLFAWGDTRFSNVDTATNDMMLATLQLGTGPAALTQLPKASIENLSVAASQYAYPGGAERIGATFTSKLVVVGKGDVEGAQAGAVLARANASPLMVVGDSLAKDQKEEVERLHTRGVYVVGDTSSVSDKVVTELTSAGVITAAPPPAPTTVATAPPTTAAGSPSTTAPASTTTTVATPTSGRNDVTRITGATPAALGKAIAEAMDVRTPEEKGRSLPAFGGAVVVNPATPEAAAGIAFAAASRYPVLFVGTDSVPTETADTFNSMGVKNTFVIGGTSAVSDAVMAKLPGAKRLGGADVNATTTAVVDETEARGMPVNVVYLADQGRPVDAAVAAAAVSRTGGLLLVNPGADRAAAESSLDAMGLDPAVDRIVIAQSTAESAGVPWV
ncbi:MAG: cell wall-binding repeat-containing protein, partial [Acidimicrobiales bacterium]